MGLDKVLELDVAYDNKAYGNLIDPYEWNANFKKIEEITNKNAETINANLDSLTEETGAALIGSAPIESLGQSLPSTVDEQLRLLADQSLNVYNKEDMDGMLSDLLTNITFDEATGSFTVSFKNGNTTTINTNLEKIPATFELITNVDNTVYLRVTNEDGSYSDTDVSSLLNLYDFHSTECIEVESDGKNVTSRLKEGCITLLHLTDEAKQYIEDYANQAKADALSAQTAATSAQANADSVRSTLSDVTMKAAEVESHHIAVTDKMSTIEQNVLLSKSWATGGTGARLNEDFNNAKYWAEQAKQIAEDNVTLDVVAEKIGEGTVANAVDETGYLPISYSLSGVFKLARLQISTLISHIKSLLTATDVKISDRLSTELGLANGNVEGALTMLNSKSVELPDNLVCCGEGEDTEFFPLDADTLGGKTPEYYLQATNNVLKSNPNLLINADFRNPLNTLGKSEYVGVGACIDGWELTAQTSIELTDEGMLVNIVPNASNIFVQHARQYIDVAQHIGKTLTLSAICSEVTDGQTAIRMRLAKADGTFIAEHKVIITEGLTTVTGEILEGTEQLRVEIGNWTTDTTSVLVQSIKLEEGTESTIMYDLMQDPNVELAKLNALSGGSGFETELLWENASPTSNFASQTVSIDNLTKYNHVLVAFSSHTSLTQKTMLICKKGFTSIFVGVKNSKVCVRAFTVNETNIHFQDVTNITTYGSGTSDTSKCIPMAIYGIK